METQIWYQPACSVWGGLRQGTLISASTSAWEKDAPQLSSRGQTTQFLPACPWCVLSCSHSTGVQNEWSQVCASRCGCWLQRSVHSEISIKLYIYDVRSFSWVCYMSMRQFLNSRFSKLSLGNHISISFNGESHGCENYQWWYHTVAEMYHNSLLCQRLSLFSGGSEPNVRVNSAACGRKSKNTQDRMKQPQGKFQGHLRNLTASL